MSLRIVLDSNLAAEWIAVLEQAGGPEVYWSVAGSHWRPGLGNHGLDALKIGLS